MPHLFKNEMKSDKILKKIVRVLIILFCFIRFLDGDLMSLVQNRTG